MPTRPLVVLIAALAGGVALIAAVVALRPAVAPRVEAPPGAGPTTASGTATARVSEPPDTAPASTGVAPSSSAGPDHATAAPNVASRTETVRPRAARDVAAGTRRHAAPELTIGVLFGGAEHGDTSLNAAVREGLANARRHGPLRVVPHEPAHGRAWLEDPGGDAPALVIAVGAAYADGIRAATARHPHVRFLLLDAELPGESAVRSVTFRGDEGGFLAGVAAAAETERGAVGMIAAMSTPALEAFECAWETGVRWGTREAFRLVRGVVLYLGTTPEAFVRPAEAEARSRELIEDKGVDVIVAAAGGSSAGVLEAARRARVKAIGIDMDVGALSRDVVITSIRKRADRIVDTTVADLRRGTFRGGATVMNVANAGIELTSAGTLAPATRKLVDKARAGIVAGRVDVCVKEADRVPAWNFPPRPQG